MRLEWQRPNRPFSVTRPTEPAVRYAAIPDLAIGTAWASYRPCPVDHCRRPNCSQAVIAWGTRA